MGLFSDREIDELLATPLRQDPDYKNFVKGYEKQFYKVKKGKYDDSAASLFGEISNNISRSKSDPERLGEYFGLFFGFLRYKPRMVLNVDSVYVTSIINNINHFNEKRYIVYTRNRVREWAERIGKDKRKNPLSQREKSNLEQIIRAA